jgi:hypothetical protein
MPETRSDLCQGTQRKTQSGVASSVTHHHASSSRIIDSFNQVRLHLRDMEGTKFTTGPLEISPKGEQVAGITIPQPTTYLDMAKGQRIDYHCGI